MSEANRVFVQALRFPRIFQVFLYMISRVLIRDFRGVNEVFCWEGVRKTLRGDQVQEQLSNKKSLLNYVFFLIFGYGPLANLGLFINL